MGVNYRCGSMQCRKRVTLKKPIDHYVERPTCKVCGEDSLSPTKFDNTYDANRTCYCTGIGWPHRKGAIIDAHATCNHADEVVVAELGFHEDIGVESSERMHSTDECPF